MSCSEWKEYRLDEIGDIVSGGTPSTKNEDYYGNEIPWITPKDLSGYDSKYISKGERSITKLGLEKSSAKLLPKGTILFSSRAPIGYVAIAQEDLCTNQGFKNIVCNPQVAHNEFIYYRMKLAKEELESVAGGSTFKEVSGKVMKEFKIKLPSIEQQKRIASILSSLDDKIELNNEMNKTLEEMAQSIFKRWFVDFEFPNEDGQPYKSSGGEMVESELGMIPKGWQVKTINEIVNVTDYVANGSFASLKNNVKQGEEEDYAILIRLVDYNREFKGPYMYVDENGYNFLSKSKLYGGEIIISNVGANAGTVFKAPYLDKPMTLGPNSVMILKSDLDNYLYYYLTSDIGQNNIKGILGGSAQPKFNKTDFRNIQIVLPNDDIIEKFNSVINTIIEKIELISRENRIIESVRDNLLPKLISGQINIDS